MIDLILIQQRWKTSLINCRTFQSADVSSDHSLVMCNIKLRLEKLNNKPQQSCRVDLKRLKDEKTRQSYSTTLIKNFENIKPTCNLEQQATEIEEATKKALEETIPVTRTASKPWISEETVGLADEKRRLKQLKNVSIEYAQQYKEFCRQVNKSARQDKEYWIHEQYEQAEKGLNIGNTKEAYGLIKVLRKEFVPRLNVIRSEVQAAIQGLKRNKTPGSNGTTAEML